MCSLQKKFWANNLFFCKFSNHTPGIKYSGNHARKISENEILDYGFQIQKICSLCQELESLFCFESHWLILYILVLEYIGWLNGGPRVGKLFPSSYFDWHKRNSTDFLPTLPLLVNKYMTGMFHNDCEEQLRHFEPKNIWMKNYMHLINSFLWA